ncbi:MAG: hypothetical protein Q9170_000461 [Blastenia crenularia]
MTTEVPCSQIYYLSVGKDHDAIKYVENRAYIPGVLLSAPSPLFFGDEQSLESNPRLLKLRPAGRKSDTPDVLGFALNRRYLPDAISPEATQESSILPEDIADSRVFSHTFTPQLAYNEGVDLGTCYVCHLDGAEGDYRTGCGNIERHTEQDGWAHGSCVGFEYARAPEDDWLCHDCGEKLVELHQHENKNFRRTKLTNEGEVEKPISTRISGKAMSSAMRSTQILAGETHQPSGRGAWNSGGYGVVEGRDYTLMSKPVKGLAAPATSRLLKGIPNPPQTNKRALQGEDLSDLPKDGQERKSRKSSQGIHDKETQALVVRFLKEEIADGNLTEQKWQAISQKLAKHGITRSQYSVKAWWSRKGRSQTGFDERQNPNGRKLVTSKQNPDDRRRARQRKQTMSGRSKVSNISKNSKHG